MDRKNAKEVMNDLQNFPFICHDEFIVTNSGYIITTKKYQKQLEAAIEKERSEKR